MVWLQTLVVFDYTFLVSVGIARKEINGNELNQLSRSIEERKTKKFKRVSRRVMSDLRCVSCKLGERPSRPIGEYRLGFPGPGDEEAQATTLVRRFQRYRRN